MQSYRHLKILIIFLLLVSIEIVLMTAIGIQTNSGSCRQNFNRSVSPFSIKGLKLQTYESGKLESALSAGEIKINPRNFFVFNVKALNELSLKDVSLAFYKKRGASSGINFKNLKHLNLSRSSAQFSTSKNTRRREIKTGLITRGVINNIVFYLYNENNLLITIKARKAYINFRKNKAKFADATVEDMISSKIIKSRVVVLRGNDLKLKVPGKYLLRSSSGVQKGRKLEMTL